MARSRASTWLPDRQYGYAQHTSVAGRPGYAENARTNTAQRALSHYRAMQRVLIYLAGTMDRELLISPQPTGMELYSDANWASKFSTSGGIILYGGAPIYWYSRLQRSVVHSTAEAEYIAASTCCREAIFIYELLTDLDAQPPLPLPLRLDNKSAIDMAFDPVSFKKTKHILREAHYLRDLVARGKIRPSHVISALQRADIYTKALGRVAHVAERDALLHDGAKNVS